MRDYDIVAPDKMWDDHVARVDRYLRRRQDFNEMLFGSFGREQKITPMLPRLRAGSQDRLPTIPRAYQVHDPADSPVAGTDYVVQDGIPESPALRPTMSQYSQDSSLRSIQISEQKALLGSFEDFWIDHCQIYAKIALRMFYLGMVSLLASLALLMYAKLEHTYHNRTAALVFASFIFISVVGTIYVVVAIKNKVDPQSIADSYISLDQERLSARQQDQNTSTRHLDRSSRNMGIQSV